ncbi:hypothetical protein MMC12_006502 [Toensbergia leucococca]|nr:hypothetical protein [Toensbergia leucococca]
MATFLSRHPVQSQPEQEISSTTPPDKTMFHTNNISHRAPSTRHTNGTRSHYRTSAEYTGGGTKAFTNGDGAPPVPVPNGAQPHMANGGSRNMGRMGGGAAAFDTPRSPPNTKNTSHVPCKFFRSGQCQAGKACPFLHSTDVSTVDTPCKYFAKGNCKFGAKCALAHVLPNGRRVNRPNGMMGGHLNLGGRVDPQSYHHQDSALANSLLAQQANGNQLPFGHQFSQALETDFTPQISIHTKLYNNLPSIDTSYASHPDSKYGSPRDDILSPLSPVAHLSTLDAPLPASFDSQGISYMARHGPVAASVPSKFGLESPPSSLPRKSALPTDALRNLHDSAFGRSKIANLGSSPLGSGDESFGQRTMHSQRVPKPKMMSASLPRPRANEEWDEGFLFGGEEDFLPTSLHDLLTPQEKMRRLSRTEQDSSIFRESLSGLGTPAESASKVGSASPSRFGALFARQKREEETNGVSNSAFGQVGSPLRNSSLHPGASPSLRALSHPMSGDVSPFLASPPRQSSMSMISQQLQRTRLSNRAESNDTTGNSSTPSLHPRLASGSNGRLDRAVSSSRIDEEQGECVFSMEEEEYNGKRYSGGWGYARSPALGTVGGARQGLGQQEGKDLEAFYPGRN